MGRADEALRLCRLLRRRYRAVIGLESPALQSLEAALHSGRSLDDDAGQLGA
jgi:hypothetical protein